MSTNKNTSDGNGKTSTSSNTDSKISPAAAALIEAMEEDDEFEEFDPEHWNKADQQEETQQWMDNWDDDMDDDFTKNLREELLKSSTSTTTTTN
jgi:DSS1/SEM1 family